MCNLHKISKILEESLEYKKTLIWMFSTIVSILCYFMVELEPTKIFFVVFVASIISIIFFISLVAIIQKNLEKEYKVLKILLIIECIIAIFIVVEIYKFLVWTIKDFALFQMLSLFFCLLGDSLILKYK